MKDGDWSGWAGGEEGVMMMEVWSRQGRMGVVRDIDMLLLAGRFVGCLMIGLGN